MIAGKKEPKEAKTSTNGALAPGRRASQYATRDLTEGSIPRNLIFLAWPQIIAGFMRTADQLADLFWAGLIDFRAVGGLGSRRPGATSSIPAAQVWIRRPER